MTTNNFCKFNGALMLPICNKKGGVAFYENFASARSIQHRLVIDSLPGVTQASFPCLCAMSMFLKVRRF
ncbi:hypothetical protein NC652_019472 [Populus alba x Populus x berolinensis]|nr:hypothetical protein NC652_019472 [Populus alba x Populus x berolinensis]